MNTLRFSAFSDKKEYNKFMRKMRQRNKESINDDFLHIIDCSCGSGHKTITTSPTIEQLGYEKRETDMGFVRYVKDKDVDIPQVISIPSKEFDRIMMGETQ